jgi:ABC-2 type transport system ATP-binding protein
MIADLYDRFDGRPLAAATRGVVKRFGATVALDGLELAVPEGAFYVLVGPNGAGKTTALRTLLDLARPEAGVVTVLGLPVATRGAEARARIGWVPERQDAPPPGFTVARLLAHHARYFPAWDAAYAERLARALELPAGARYGTLSKGQARRAQLVLALAHRPPLLLLDEPTDGLDPLARDRVAELLADHLAATPTTVVLSTHRVHEVEGLGDCVGVLRGGRLAAQLDRERLRGGLHRVRLEAADGWRPPPELAGAVLRRAGSGREVAWTVWGDPEAIGARLAATGATVRAVDPLNLEQATLALLAMEGPEG